MKRLFFITISVLAAILVTAQDSSTFSPNTCLIPSKQKIAPLGIEVSFNKTVHIIFPSPVKYVDLGSPDLIAGKADGTENVVRVKSAVENFKTETNFTVICIDGSFYNFNARYVAEPSMLNIEMDKQGDSSFSGLKMNIYFKELAGESPLIVNMAMKSIYTENARPVRHLGSNNAGIQFTLKGIYVRNGLFYLHTQIKNSSYVPFDIDFIRFKVVDKKIAKRTAVQEDFIYPVRSFNELTFVSGWKDVRTIYVLPKFTLPKDKMLIIELFEKNGGRHQSIQVESNDIGNATLISEIKL